MGFFHYPLLMLQVPKAIEISVQAKHWVRLGKIRLQLEMEAIESCTVVSGARGASPRVKAIPMGFAMIGFPQFCVVSHGSAGHTKLVEDGPTHVQPHS